ncbi:cysteine-rich receptor-like protein kinase [Striga asiatica]|uniref:Cysteine-rich receptor-like protein kinase n=1 Tax=Striga asiatica TaxID=4170 RepID=A0A5A7R5M3_STRAF|nr:cysteine-rich receptor-like protein kinase [Striga asiatica]
MLRASLLLVLLLLLFMAQAQAQAQPICLNNGGNYTFNSTYSDNLNTVLSSISDTTTTGFHNASAGRAHAIALCRADIHPVSCRTCIQNITSDLLTSCPRQRQAIGWSEHCMLQYSDEPVYGILRTWPRVYLSSTQNATSPDKFVSDLRALLDGLRAVAASGGARWKAAAGNASGPDFRSIFALVQCTPDLSAEDCGRCLVEAAGALSDCCWGSVGARVNLRPAAISVTRFRLSIMRLGWKSWRAGPTQTSRVNRPLIHRVRKGNNVTRVVSITVISIVACAVFVVFVCLLLRKKTRRKPEENRETAANNEVSVDESLIYALGTIRDATKDFSDDYKMGQGGFNSDLFTRQGDLEFKNEVLLLAKLQHRNLFRLLGFFINDIALLCVQENAADRPTMASVIVMLNSSSLTLATPIEPAFFMPADYGSETSLL